MATTASHEAIVNVTPSRSFWLRTPPLGDRLGDTPAIMRPGLRIAGVPSECGKPSTGDAGAAPAAPVEPSRIARPAPDQQGRSEVESDPRHRPGLPKNLTLPQGRPPHPKAIGRLFPSGGRGQGEAGGAARTTAAALACR
jgi:hypothetical protein